MSLLSLFKWFDHTQIAVWIRSSTYLFPAIEVVHLLGLTLLYGAVLVVDLRLLGFGMRRQTVSRLAAQVGPFASLGIGVMLLTGIPLFLSEALKCYANSAFWFKIGFFLAALVFQYTIHRGIVSSDQTSPIASKLTGCFSMMLWLGVGLGGRAIAFV
jgi:hypothetical protein